MFKENDSTSSTVFVVQSKTAAPPPIAPPPIAPPPIARSQVDAPKSSSATNTNTSTTEK